MRLISLMGSLPALCPPSLLPSAVARLGASLLFSLALSAVPTWAQNATPHVDILSPAVVAPGRGQDVQLKIKGAGFDPNAQVNFNGANLTPTSVTNTDITVVVPAADLSAAGTAKVTVVNPNTPPAVGSSNVAFFYREHGGIDDDESNRSGNRLPCPDIDGRR